MWRLFLKSITEALKINYSFILFFNKDYAGLGRNHPD
jgi:hypothetical protein